jgi:hypothetical protein
MPADSRSRPPEGVPGAAQDRMDDDAAPASTTLAASQARPPRERHNPIPTDKIALFAVAPVARLAGVWQGPGSIASLRRRA